MFWIKSLRARKKHKARIAALEKRIDDAYLFDYGLSDSKEDRLLESQIIEDQTKYDRNELDILQQDRLRQKAKLVGLAIPSEMLTNDQYPLRSILSDDGEAWVKRELYKIFLAKVEFWSKLILPIAALILSIIALAKK